ncbi:MAG: DUF116 domain-containing protein [Bacillota bacterium]|jgi:hypothetical protein
MAISSKKRLFMGLLAVSVAFLAACAFFFIFFAFHPVSSFFQIIILIIGLAIAAVLIIAGLGILFVALSIWNNRQLGPPGRLFLRGALMLYPLALIIGRIFAIDKEKIQASFVEVNNHLVRSYEMRLEPADILILLPHCLQKSSCQSRVTQDINNCHHCGGCDIGDVVELSESLGINAVVITGGTLARICIKNFRPKAIIAVACERDLAAGILDVGSLPVLGVCNSRPQGPCKDTRVDIDEIRQAIDFFI